MVTNVGESLKKAKNKRIPGEKLSRPGHYRANLNFKKENPPKVFSGNESILIIEDEEMLLQLEKTIFERLGYTIYSAENGIEGCRIFEQNQNNIDLVILDMIMPKMDGPEALKRIKRKKKSIKVILISGNDLPKHIVDDFVAGGASAFIQKPFEIPQLTDLVRKVLDE